MPGNALVKEFQVILNGFAEFNPDNDEKSVMKGTVVAKTAAN